MTHSNHFRPVHLGLIAASLAATPALAAGPVIWALGDSLTSGHGLHKDQGFTAQLQAALQRSGVQATVYNGGVSGDTSAKGLKRFASDLNGLGTKPDLVIVELGANDMLRHKPPQATEQNLDAILGELRRRNIRFVIAGMKAMPNLDPAYRAQFDAIYPRLARKYRAPLYPFFLDQVAGHRELIQRDRLHPNPDGVAVIVRNIMPQVRSALAAQPRRQGQPRSADASSDLDDGNAVTAGAAGI